MGQKMSIQPNAPLVWILRGQPKMHPNPEQPIKFQYKTRRKNFWINNKGNQINSSQVETNSDDVMFIRPSAILEPNETQNTINKLPGETFGVIALAPNEGKQEKLAAVAAEAFGYDIEDIDHFLARASLEKPANIPVVLSVPAVLYQTRLGGYQAEVALPLGMVVNAVFRNQHWLYAQTPHGEEGYVVYAVCIPLGIGPAADEDITSPCWETSTDVFPRPSGNMANAEELSTRSEGGNVGTDVGRHRRKNRGKSCRQRRRATTSVVTTSEGESSVDRLYLRAASAASTTSNAVRRHTLLVVSKNYAQEGVNTVSVQKGDVVTLLGTQLKGWFWVRRSEGAEGFIPAAVADYGYL